MTLLYWCYTDSKRILDYVEQRYLTRVRIQNISNFGMVLAKSLLKGVPEQWEALYDQIITSLVAVRDRADDAWSHVSLSIVRLIDNLEPQYRPRAIAFIAAFNEFWIRLQEPTRTVLLETIETPKLLLGMLRNTLPADLPTMDTRTRFYHHLERNYCITKYGDVLTILQTDGWVLPPPE